MKTMRDKKKIGKKILAGFLALVMTAGSLPFGEMETKAAVPSKNLLARYELLEDVKDDSGNGNHGTAYGNVTYGTGDRAGMILPGGSSLQNYVQIPGDMFEGQEYLTISAWINSNTNPGNYSAIFFGTAAQNNNMPLNYWLFNPCSPQGNFKTAFTNSNNSGAPYNSEVLLNNTMTSQNKGSWVHYTTVITPTSLVGYINGELIGSIAKTKTVSEFGTDLYAYLGRSNYLTDTDFAGSYQDVCIFNTVLTAAEIQELMGEAPAENTQEVVMELASENFEVTGLDGATGITSDIELPDTAGYGTAVTWSSDKPEVISADGTVTQGESQQTVTLTATITLGGLKEEKTFSALVPGKEEALYLHYDFSQVNGTTIPDLSGNGHDGTIRGNNYRISENVLTLPGGAYGSGAAYVEIPTGTFDGQDALTITLWLKNETGSGNYAAMYFGTTENLPTGYWLLNPCNLNGYLKSVITNSRSTNAPYNTEYGISPTVNSQGITGPKTDDEWAMYTTVIRPGSITVYYNNTYIGTVQTSRTVSDFGTSLVSYIGKSSYSDMFYKGGVRDVRVYTYGLERESIVNLYYAGLGDAEAAGNALQEDADSLVLPYYYVSEDINLPEAGKNGSKITWSSDSTYLDKNGNVTLPTAAEGDQIVELTATLTLGEASVTKTFSLVVLADTAASDLVTYMDEQLITSTAIKEDITLPATLENGATVTWSSASPEVLKADGKVTRPEKGNGNQEVVLTALVTYQGVTTEKTFTITIAEKPYGNILTYIRSGETDRTDALHIGYSEDDGQTYQALFNNQPILYSSNGAKMMGSPMYFHKADGTYGMISDDNHNSGYVLIYDSEDLLTFTNPRYVAIDTTGNFVSNPDCVYVESKGAYAIRYNGSDGKSYMVYTIDFESFTEPTKIDYVKPAVDGKLPTDAIEAGVFEATLEEYEAILRKYSRVVNTAIDEFEAITVDTGTNKNTIEKPETVTAQYSDGSEKSFGVTWDEADWALVDTSTPGTYKVKGTITQPDYGNVLIEQRADPYVVQAADGSYYFTASYPVCGDAEERQGIGYDRIILRHADTINGLANAKEVTIWNQADSAKAFRYIWAPEMHYIGGSWYILFTASRSGSVWDIRPHMLKCVGDDPMDPASWKTSDESNLQQVQAYNGDNAFVDFSLDMTYFESDGRHFVAWAEKPNNISKIFLAEIDPDEPWKLISNHIVVSEPDFAWEWSGGTVINEGPAVLKHNGKIHLCFSGAAVDYTYCVGMMTAEEGADLLNLDSWTKHPVALLKSEDFEVEGYDPQCGPGHNSFTYDENGNPIIVYHARPMNCSNAIDANGNWGSCSYVGTGQNALSDPCRHARAKSLNFAYDGTPILNMTKKEELATTEVTLTIVVQGEAVPPTEFYAEKGVTVTLPAENVKELVSTAEGAVCEIASDGGISFTSNVCGDMTIVFKQKNGTEVTYVIHVYALENKTYVLDYGLKVNLNAAGDDAFGLYPIGDSTTYGMTGDELPTSADSVAAVLDGFRISGSDAAYQMKVESEGAVLECTGDSLYYTPTAFMEDADRYEYQVEVKQSVNHVISSVKDGVIMDAALTIVPANVIYYEDDFTAITYTGTNDKAGNAQELIQSNDQDGVYGYDVAYGSAAQSIEDLILHYDFSQVETTADGVVAEGTIVQDLSGNYNDAVVYGDNVTINGDVLTLPGTEYATAPYLQLPNGLNYEKTAMTVSMWLKSDRDNWFNSVFYLGNESATRFWMLNPRYQNNVRAIVKKSNGGENVLSPSGMTVTGEWALHTMVLEDYKLSFYLNGRRYGELSTDVAISDLGDDSIAYIGNSGFVDDYYNGEIRDVRIYDRALTEKEVAILYEGEATLDSAGGSTRLEAASNDARGTMTFTFKGTGFDLIGRSTSETAGLSLVVQDTEGSVVYSQIVDTGYANGALYQLPIINVTGLDHGTYTVTVRAMRTDTSNSIFIDAVRIYNPALNDNSVTNQYNSNEQQADIVNVRDLLLGDVKFTDIEASLGASDENAVIDSGTSSVSLVRYETGSGDLTIYHGSHAQIENPGSGNVAGEMSTLEEILKTGPNNEVYLTKQNAIAFRAVPILDTQEKTLQIEAKKVSDDGYASAQISMVTDRTDKDMQVFNIQTYTPMYYEIDLERCVTYDDGSYLVIIASGSDSIVSLGNIKVAGYQLEALADSDYSDSGTVISDTYNMFRTFIVGTLPFVDVEKDSWYETYVRYVFKENIMTGMNETHFGPYENLSRAQFALILYRMEGEPAFDTEKSFGDIAGDEWYGPAVLWAAKSGIVTGYLDGNFGPADNITREQMAVMMYRYANYQGKETTEKGDYSSFIDAASVSEFAADAVKWTVGKQIITGKKEGTVIDPQGSTVRAEAAAIITRYMEQFK